MTSALARYDRTSLPARLGMVVAAAVLANALYCLAYTYSAGRPSTLGEALSWGVVNLAPWVAAMEIGRHLGRATQIAVLVLAAGIFSLALGVLLDGAPLDTLELVRRIPGALLAVVALVGLELYRRKRSANHDGGAATGEVAELSCDWAQAAGNYVELHRHGEKPRLLRSTFKHYVEAHRASLVRIHRSYAVRREAVARIERAHVLLHSGDRLPLGNAYRAALLTA